MGQWIDLPPGRYAIAVSGGADSVALLRAMTPGPHVVVHIDHQTRAGESARDAAFVEALAVDLGLPFELSKRDALEAAHGNLPANRSARYRQIRLIAYADCVKKHNLHGVLLAHHRQDQAETVLLRLLRGSGPAGLCGMAARQRLGSLTLLRPLLEQDPQALRAWLQSIGQPWREDASNADPSQRRNAIRPWLRGDASLTAAMLQLASQCRRWCDYLEATTPILPWRFRMAELADLDPPQAEHAARRWLKQAGVPADDLSPAVLVALCTDAASPPAHTFPGGVHVRRRKGWVESAQAGPEGPDQDAR